MFLALASLLVTAHLDPVWVQTSFGYVDALPNHTVWGIGNFGTLSASYLGSQGTDPNPPSGLANPYQHVDQWGNPQKITGDSPSPAPSWDSRFDPLSSAYVYQSWFFSNGSIPPNTNRACVVHWEHKTGFQQFEQQVGGGFNGTTARRDLDWWIPKGFEMVDTPGNGGPQ